MSGPSIISNLYNQNLVKSYIWLPLHVFVSHWPCKDGSISCLLETGTKPNPCLSSWSMFERRLRKLQEERSHVFPSSFCLCLPFGWVFCHFFFLHFGRYLVLLSAAENTLSHDDGWQDFIVCFGVADYSCGERTVCLFLLCPLFGP